MVTPLFMVMRRWTPRRMLKRGPARFLCQKLPNCGSAAGRVHRCRCLICSRQCPTVEVFRGAPMPIYAFRCEACGHSFDRLQKLSDPDPAECPGCGKTAVKRQVTAPAFRLAGSGWYETDFKSDKDKKRNLAGDAAKPKPAEPAKSGGSGEAAKSASTGKAAGSGSD